MRRRFVLLAGLLAILGGFSTTNGVSAATPARPEKAARGLLERLLPGRAAQFIFETIEPEGGSDVFELESKDGKVLIRGSSAVAMASGLNWYLKYCGHCQVSFCGDQLALADPPPRVPEKVRRVCHLRYRYCFNYCAFSYTMAFWDWAQWERMIDWMALHGINLPLSVTGQEAIWQKVYRDLGLSDDEIAQFFVGPAFLPFGWMGCLDGWGGPVPKSWIASHAELEKKIVARQRELGMTPVLQGFTGHVPQAIQTKFPQARLRQLPRWSGFPGTYFVDPTDPLFQRIGKAFIEEQTRQFGSDHLYASDTFIEMEPPSSDPQFLADMGRAIYRGMAEADPQAVWVLQGWIFFFKPKFWKPPQTRAFLGAVPNDRMLLLDLYCEVDPVWRKTEAFCGKQWAFCALHSFGAQVSLHGGLSYIEKNLQTALHSPNRGNLQGVGLTMEGFGHEPVVFDYVTDAPWHGDVPKLDGWLRDYVRSRYGRPSAAADEAWKVLQQTVYRRTGQSGSILCARPKLGLGSGALCRPLAPAWQKLLEAADDVGGTDTYRFDLVNLSRQVLTGLARSFYDEVVAAYRAKDRAALAAAGRRLTELIGDMDDLLATRREFLLGQWLQDAKRWATNDEERRLYEWNARLLITLWGPRDSGLHEYSQREWCGMMSGFYLPRWQMFLAALDHSLAENKPLDTSLDLRLRRWEDTWTHGNQVYRDAPTGDSLATARKLWKKYAPAISRARQ
jgi:alpha-N-acetylglucosaminidase